MMDVPVELRESHFEYDSIGRMIWVDTIYIAADAMTYAICVTRDGQIRKFKIDDLYVCEDAKPRILLDPSKLQAAMAKRGIGGKALMGMSGAFDRQSGVGMSVERIPAEQAGNLGLRFNGPGKLFGVYTEISNKDIENGEDKKET